MEGIRQSVFFPVSEWITAFNVAGRGSGIIIQAQTHALLHVIVIFVTAHCRSPTFMAAPRVIKIMAILHTARLHSGVMRSTGSLLITVGNAGPDLSGCSQ